MNILCKRQNPARLPYSYRDSMLGQRTPGFGAAPTISERRCCRMNGGRPKDEGEKEEEEEYSQTRMGVRPVILRFL